MAVKMRLRRMGQKKAPFYRIVVANGAQPTEIVAKLLKQAGIEK